MCAAYCCVLASGHLSTTHELLKCALVPPQTHGTAFRNSDRIFSLFSLFSFCKIGWGFMSFFSVKVKCTLIT